MSSVERIVAPTEPTVRQQVFDSIVDRFTHQEKWALTTKEREQTEEEKQLIDLANRVTDSIRERYGLTSFTVPYQNIHVIPHSEWTDQRGTAQYSVIDQGIAIREAKPRSVFLKKLIHEMLHLKSHNAVIADPDGSRVREYRMGLVIARKQGGAYFYQLNEALTEEMTKEAFLSLDNEPALTSEQHQTKQTLTTHKVPRVFMADPTEILHAEPVVDRRGKVISLEVEKFTYARERKILNTLIEKIYQKRSSSDPDKEPIKDLFRQAAIRGDLLPLARTVETAFGKGTFRKIAELDSNLDELEQYIASLG